MVWISFSQKEPRGKVWNWLREILVGKIDGELVSRCRRRFERVYLTIHPTEAVCRFCLLRQVQLPFAANYDAIRVSLECRVRQVSDAAQGKFWRPFEASFGRPLEVSFGRPLEASFEMPLEASFGRPIKASFGRPLKASFGGRLRQVLGCHSRQVLACRSRQVY